MKLEFLGATHEVTGSKTLLEIGGEYALVDCGMAQGADVFENAVCPISAEKISYVFLTHAHVDHSGNLPLLYKEGFRGIIYCTKETANLCNIMLKDCAHIQESEAKYRTRKAKRAGRTEVAPTFTLSDAENVLKLFRPCSYDERIMIDENISVRFTDVGHLLGSSCIELWLTQNRTEKKIVFSGDIGNTNQPIIKDPATVADADYVVIESTYGTRVHEQRREDAVERLAYYIDKTLSRGGNLIIPSFAVGRTQEMLYFIREIKEKGLVKGCPGFQVYVDSPLANEATSIYQQCDTKCLDADILAVMKSGNNPLVFPGLNTYISTEESKMLNFDPTPKVIISASGMCDAGRVCHHLKYNLWRKECTVLFVGYQAVGTLGRLIYDGEKSVRLFGDDIAINAEVASLEGVSGHADKNGLINWLSGFQTKPSQVFVNHGSDESCTEFAKCLCDEHGYNAFAPFSGTVYDLQKGDFVEITQGIPAEKKRQSLTRTKSGKLFDSLVSCAKRLVAVAKSCEGIPNKDIEKFTSEITKLSSRWENYRK